MQRSLKWYWKHMAETCIWIHFFFFLEVSRQTCQGVMMHDLDLWKKTLVQSTKWHHCYWQVPELCTSCSLPRCVSSWAWGQFGTWDAKILIFWYPGQWKLRSTPRLLKYKFDRDEGLAFMCELPLFLRERGKASTVWVLSLTVLSSWNLQGGLNRAQHGSWSSIHYF